jgi:hypothetical protein
MSASAHYDRERQMSSYWPRTDDAFAAGMRLHA